MVCGSFCPRILKLGEDYFEKVSYGTDIGVKFYGLHLLLQFSETFGVRWLILLFFFCSGVWGKLLRFPCLKNFRI